MHTGHRQLGYLLAPGTLLLLLPMGMALAGHVSYRMQNYAPDRPTWVFFRKMLVALRRAGLRRRLGSVPMHKIKATKTKKVKHSKKVTEYNG